MSQRGIHARIVVGIILVIVGLLLFAQNYPPFENIIPDFIYQWEYLFILFGLLFVILSQNKMAGFIFIAIGLFSLYPDLWPLIFVLIGARIIFGWNGKRRITHSKFRLDSDKKNDNDYIEQVSIFGGGTKVFTSNNFKGGNIVSIFGGSEINLTNCILADGENVLEFVSIFGGSTIIVPADWKIDVDILPIFGGFGDKRRRDPNMSYSANRSLIIKGVAIFGGGEVKTIF
jgi:predicted membrane protein